MSQSYNRILLFGAGAIGGYFGGQLALAGRNIEFIARGSRLEAMRENGLTLKSGEIQTNIKINVSAKPSGIYDLIIFAVKSQDTKTAAESCKNNLAEDGAVLSLQNGVDNLHPLADVFGKHRVVGAVVRSGISVPQPGVVHYLPGSKIILGGMNDDAKIHEKPLLALLQGAGIDSAIAKDIHKELWLKLMWNIAFNPLSAITRATCGALLNDGNSYEIMKALAEETARTAEACGIRLPDDAVEKTLELRVVYNDYKTSALQDVEANRKPEIEALFAPVLMAEEAGLVEAPVSRTICQTASFMFSRWFHTSPRLSADVIIITSDGKILLIERKFPPYGWAIPGGFMDLGETIEHAALRELQEETGICLEEHELNLLGVYSDPARDVRAHTVTAVYYAYSDAKATAADDAKNAAYFCFDGLPELAFDHAKIIADLRKKLGKN